MTRFAIYRLAASVFLFSSCLVGASATTSWARLSCSSAPNVVASIETPGQSYEVAYVGDHAYVADGDGGLQVIDVSNPTTPVIVGSAAILGARGVAIAGSYAYVVGMAGLQVVDISNPAMPVILGPAAPAGVGSPVVVGDYAYVANGDAGLFVIDVSDPSAPAIVGSINTPGITTDVAVAGNYAYTADDFPGVHVIDITDPTMPVIVGTFEAIGQSHVVDVLGNTLYSNNTQLGLDVIDISVPTSPALVTTLPMSCNDIVVAGNSVYLTTGNHGWGLTVLDATAPAAPEVARYVYTHRFANGIAVGGSYACVTAAGGGMVMVVDLAPPDLVVGSVETPSSGLGLAVAGDHAYVAAGASGLQVIDVSALATPMIVGAAPTPGAAADVVVAGGYAYVPMGTAGLRVIDVSVPGAPVGVRTLPGNFANVVLAGDMLYATVGNPLVHFPKQFLVYDLAAPDNPAFLGGVNTPSGVFGVAAAGTYAYVTSSSGLLVIDVSTPTSPVIVGAVSTPGVERDVAVAGSFAYVADGPGGVQVIDVTVPTAPMIVGNVSTVEDAYRVAVVDGYVCAMEQLSMRIYLIPATAPSYALIAGIVDAPGTPNGIVGHGEQVYVASGGFYGTGTGRLVVYPPLCTPATDAGGDAGGPSALGPIQRVAAGLQVSYAIANGAERVRLSVYDARGQRLRVLTREPHPSGRFFRVWDGRTEAGRPAASGVYFFRLEVDAETHARKSIWIR